MSTIDFSRPSLRTKKNQASFELQWESGNIIDSILGAESTLEPAFEFTIGHTLDDLFTTIETPKEDIPALHSHQNWEEILLGTSKAKTKTPKFESLEISHPSKTKVETKVVTEVETKVVNTIDAMRYMMNVIITKDNIKRIALGLSISTILLVSTGGGSGLWTFATYLATSTGTKLGTKTITSLASKKLKFLNKKISPPETLSRWSKKLGLSITENTTYADLLESAINGSAVVAQGGALSFLITHALVQGASLAKNSFSTAGSLDSIRKIPEKLIEKLSAPGEEKVNLVDFVTEVEEEVIEEVSKIEKSPVVLGKSAKPTRRVAKSKVDQRKEDIFLRNEKLRAKIGDKKTETIDLPALEVASKGRILAYAAGLGTVLVGFATGTIDASFVTMATEKVVDIAKEHKLASDMISKLVVGAGSNQVASILGLTIDQKSGLDTLIKKFSSGETGVVKQILSLVTKGEIYGEPGLKKLSKSELLEVARSRNIKVSGSSNIKSVRKAILATEAKALADSQMLIQTLIANVAIGAVGNTLASGALDVLQTKNGPVEIVDPNSGNPITLPKDVTFDSYKVQKDIDFLRQTMVSGSDTFIKSQSLASAEIARAQNEIADSLARSVAKEAIKAQRETKLADQSFFEQTIRSGASTFEIAELAREQLRLSAMALQSAVEGGIIASMSPGTDLGVNSPELLDPRIQKALDDFGPITPVMNVIATKTAVFGASFLESGGITQSVNYWLGVAEFAKNSYKLVKTVEAYRTGYEAPEVPEILDQVLQARIPTLSSAVELLMRADSVDLKRVLMGALQDQLTNGPDLERLYMDVGRQILWGEGATKGSGLSDWMVRQVGSTFYHSIMG